MTWETTSNSPIVMVAHEGGLMYGIYQQGKDGYAYTVRVMYSPEGEDEPMWCDFVKPVSCPSLRKAIAQAENWQRTALQPRR